MRILGICVNLSSVVTSTGLLDDPLEQRYHNRRSGRTAGLPTALRYALAPPMDPGLFFPLVTVSGSSLRA